MTGDLKEADPTSSRTRAPRPTCQHHPSEGDFTAPNSHVAPPPHGFLPHCPNGFGAPFPFAPIYRHPFPQNFQAGPPCLYAPGGYFQAPQVPSGPRNFGFCGHQLPIAPQPMYHGWPYYNAYHPPSPGHFVGSHPANMVVEGFEERRERRSIRILRDDSRRECKVETITLSDSDEESESTDSSMVAEETGPKTVSSGTSSRTFHGPAVGRLPKPKEPEPKVNGSVSPGVFIFRRKDPKATLTNGLNSDPEEPLPPTKKSTTRVSKDEDRDEVLIFSVRSQPGSGSRPNEDGSNTNFHSDSSSPSPPIIFPEAPIPSVPSVARPSTNSTKTSTNEAPPKQKTLGRLLTPTPKSVLLWSSVTAHKIRSAPLRLVETPYSASSPNVKVDAVPSSRNTAGCAGNVTKSGAGSSTSKSQFLNPKLPADNNKSSLKRPAESPESQDGRHCPSAKIPALSAEFPPSSQSKIQSEEEINDGSADSIHQSPSTPQDASDPNPVVSCVKRRLTFTTGTITGISWTTPKSKHQSQDIRSSSASPQPSTSGTQPQHSAYNGS